MVARAAFRPPLTRPRPLRLRLLASAPRRSSPSPEASVFWPAAGPSVSTDRPVERRHRAQPRPSGPRQGRSPGAPRPAASLRSAFRFRNPPVSHCSASRSWLWRQAVHARNGRPKPASISRPYCIGSPGSNYSSAAAKFRRISPRSGPRWRRPGCYRRTGRSPAIRSAMSR